MSFLESRYDYLSKPGRTIHPFSRVIRRWKPKEEIQPGIASASFPDRIFAPNAQTQKTESASFDFGAKRLFALERE